jgi:hypothetical protein
LQKVVEWSLPLLFVCGLVAVAFGNPDPLARDAWCAIGPWCLSVDHPAFWNSLLFEFGLGTSVSVLFYWLLVQLPEISKRKRLRRYLLQSYLAFRRSAVIQFLSAAEAGFVDFNLADELVPQKSFKSYFSRPSGKVDGDKWHDVANNISQNEGSELLIAMSVLRDDIQYVLNNTDVADQASFEFLQRLSRAMKEYDPRTTDYDDQKVVLRFFWQLMAGFNPATGYEVRDPVEHIIRRI